MFRYMLRRLGYGLLILVGVNLLTFFLFFTVNTPDDMARLNIGGKRITQEQIDKWKASCRLTPIRVATSWPMSVERAESLRPKSSSISDTERSHSTVRVICAVPFSAALKYSGRS